jgi:arsenate reductase-like glutaredoxin family protein
MADKNYEEQVSQEHQERVRSQLAKVAEDQGEALRQAADSYREQQRQYWEDTQRQLQQYLVNSPRCCRRETTARNGTGRGRAG